MLASLLLPLVESACFLLLTVVYGLVVMLAGQLAGVLASPPDCLISSLGSHQETRFYFEQASVSLLAVEVFCCKLALAEK